MRCYAMKDRNWVVKENGIIGPYDLDVLEAYCGATERFTEPSNGIEVLGLANASLPAGYRWETIRQFFFTHDSNEIFHLSRAKALLGWRQLTRFCGCCGTKLEDHPSQTARVCPKCGNLIFPRIEPCIITVVRRGNEILLAKHVQRNQDIYACIAGFIEAGESVEMALRREIREEVGIEVSNIRFFGSQSWPFPAQLMLAFTCDYESGDIHVQPDEIADAQFFDIDHLPSIPPPGSIAYRLIEAAKTDIAQQSAL